MQEQARHAIITIFVTIIMFAIIDCRLDFDILIC